MIVMDVLIRISFQRTTNPVIPATIVLFSLVLETSAVQCGHLSAKWLIGVLHFGQYLLMVVESDIFHHLCQYNKIKVHLLST